MKKDRSRYVNIAFYIVVVLILVIFLIFIVNNINFNKDNENGDKNEVLEIKKIDEGKEYVYDANYDLSTNKESYYGDVTHSTLVSASDLIVPYINIDNNDANRVNNEIYNLYVELINEYNENLEEEIFYTLVKYESYINNNILSVVIYTESGGTSIPIYQYYTYNFDLVTGILLSYTEVLNKMNLNKTDLDDLVKDVLAKEIHDVCDGDEEGSNQYCMMDNYNYDIFYNQSFTSYEDRVNEGSLNFYVYNNQLYIVLNPQYPTQTSGENRLFNIITGEKIR